MKMITVKELIVELQKYNPDAIVLYAYDEYGRTGTHGQISNDEYVVLDSNDNFVIIDDEIVSFCEEDVGDLNDEYQEVVDKYNNVRPTIKLFAR
jgi:hypothetical protein